MSDGLRTLAAACVVVLAGCQTLPREVPAVDDGLPAAEAFAARERTLAAHDQWSLRGRGALSADGRGWNGSVHWSQCVERMDLRFIAPLGAGTVRISGDPGLMRIRGTDGTDHLSGDVEYDLERWLGVGLPVETLRWWVLGLPAPDVEVAGLELDAGGRATAFMQAGWSVSYPRYTSHAGVVLPGLVVAERGPTRVRMIVDRWEPDPCT